MEGPASDVNYRADVETQIEILKSSGNEEAKQVKMKCDRNKSKINRVWQAAAQRLWALAESKERGLEILRQNYIVKRSAAKYLLSMLKKGNEESQWCAGRVLVQLAFANEETSTALVAGGKSRDLIGIVTDLIKSIDGCTDRIKETLFQLLNNVCSNAWSCHENIIQSRVLSHALVALRSFTVSDNVKRAAVNFVYSLTFTSVGRTTLMENDAVTCLVPIIKVNKASINSMCATLAISNLIGCRQRVPMLVGCGVPEKVAKAFENALNRKSFGGQQNSLWKIVLAVMELSKNDANKDILINEGCGILLARLLDLPADRQNSKNLEYGCCAVWHLAFNGRGKALLCEESNLLERLKEFAASDDLTASQPARGALFQLGVISRPAYADKMLHIFFSFDESVRERVLDIARKLEEANYKVWTDPSHGKLDEQFTNGVADSAAVCACLNDKYSHSAKARTELMYAADCKKMILNLVVDDESRESTWQNAFVTEKNMIDFSDPLRDPDALKQLISMLGSRGKKIIRKEDSAAPKEVELAAPKVATAAEPATVPSIETQSIRAPTATASHRGAGPHSTSRSEAAASSGAGEAHDEKGTSLVMAEGARAQLSAMDALPPEEKERLLGSRRVPIETITAWSVDEVCEWLDKTLLLEQYSESFREGSVDGAFLVDLSDEELSRDLGVHNRLHRKKILTRIKQMLGR